MLAGFVYSELIGIEHADPFSGKATGWSLSPSYNFSEVHNITRGSTTVYNTFSPDRKVLWSGTIFTYFEFRRYGVEWWDSWYDYIMEGSPKQAGDVVDDWNPLTKYTYYIFDQGGQFETHCYIYPLVDFDTNTFIYETLEESFTNNVVTVVLAADATYPTFDIGLIFGVLIGFQSYGAPWEFGLVVASIWWIMVILLVVKVVVG